MRDFVHLHVHSQYSLLDGQASISGLIDKAVKDGMKGIALTDHGSMFGVKEFWNCVQKKNKGISDPEKRFKGIIGCEMYVANRSRTQKESGMDNGGYHLIVLAKNKTGYRNLIKLVSNAWTEGFYRHPRTDREQLERHKEGLIITSACLGGEVPKKIHAGQIAEAIEAIEWYKKTFGEDYYLELQRHKATVERANHECYPLQEEANNKLIELSRQCGVKLICSNDVHFLNEEDAEAHDRLICLSTNKALNDPKRMLYSKQEWMKTTAEMNTLFADVPEALDSTVEILNKIEEYSIDNLPIMPEFPIPDDFGTIEDYRARFAKADLYQEFTQNVEGETVLTEEEGEEKIKALGGYERLHRIKLEADYLEKLAFEGAANRYEMPLSDEINERMAFELYTMKTMGFPGYFLIVQDFINAAREELNVSVGPGRGSAAGSVVAYCLGITQIDPLRYDLLFERFLNPDRISLPDIDVDFDDDGRDRVLQWVTDKYGKEKVAHIITYGTMAAKMSIKDVARVEGVSFDEANRLAKFVQGKDLSESITQSNELKDACNSPHEHIRNTMRFAQKLEGNVRGTGVHACGIIICKDPITDHVPISTAEDKETREKVPVTQYEGKVIEETGLIKMDFLGLRTLSIIKEAILYIKDSTGKEIDIDHIPLDDEITYRLFSEGRTIGIFQFESPGMQKHLRDLKPTCLEDLIAMNALYRPGPMEYIPDFINRKQGRAPIKYDLPVMEKYLQDTYGVTVYQEQVMLLSRLLADFTPGESDNLRKAMGKKLRDKLDHMKPKFIEGGRKNGHPAGTLEKIWGDWEKFASYAFNKSHAACYAWIAYQTAYLKANYPAEFMAANLSRNINNLDEVSKLMDECRLLKIGVLGPDINESNLKFAVNKEGNIRFGLGAIKNMGETAAECIVAERKEGGGAYKSAYDFFTRLNQTVCNRRMLESLTLAGAFDSFGTPRRYHYFLPSAGAMYLDTLMRYGQQCQHESANSMQSLFGEEEGTSIAPPPIPEGEEWSMLHQLRQEKELVGLYLSAHPLDEYDFILNDICTARTIDIKPFTGRGNGDAGPEDVVLRSLTPGQRITMAGIVTKIHKATDKNGNPFLHGTIEDLSGSVEISLWREDFMTWQNYFIEGQILYIQGSLRERKFNKEILEFAISSIQLMSSVKDSLVEKIYFAAPLSRISDIQALLSETPTGNASVSLQLIDDMSPSPIRPLRVRVTRKRITVTAAFIRALKENKLNYRLNV